MVPKATSTLLRGCHWPIKALGKVADVLLGATGVGSAEEAGFSGWGCVVSAGAGLSAWGGGLGWQAAIAPTIAISNILWSRADRRFTEASFTAISALQGTIW
jgi:hypothetical protein